MAFASRLALVCGAAAGLAVAPPLSAAGGSGLDLAQAGLLATLAAIALAAVRPGRPQRAPANDAEAERRSDQVAAPTHGPRTTAAPWLIALAGVAAAAGAVVGESRLRAIDAGAWAGELEREVVVRGVIAEVPRIATGELRAIVSTPRGRLLVRAPLPREELDVGQEILAAGVVRAPAEWEAARLRIRGVSHVVAVRSLEVTGGARGGLAGAVDGIRERAEAALERGMRDSEAALARGFVLGQDDRIESSTIDDFRRSGLAHLLAVSGQNVILLALLAAPILALLGLGLRARLLVVVALIALYVPLTGAGPSIQRAAVMGIAGIVALLAGRPAHRWYAIALAALLTLAVNPRAAADVGWQLSFAAVIGILLWSRPLASGLRRALRAGERGLNWRAGLAEGAAITAAATLATAPVSAHHFETVSLASLPANLLALPAVAPVMWLGMASAALGQLPWAPVGPLNWLCAHLIAYIAQVGRWFGDPGWAIAEISPPGPLVLVALAGGGALAIALAARTLRRRGTFKTRRRLTAPLAAAALTIGLAIAAPAGGGGSPGEPGASGLRVTALDVGQGDAILLEPRQSHPILVDTGLPDAGITDLLRERGVTRLSAVVATHDDADHVGGLPDVLSELPVETLIHAGIARRLRVAARAAGTEQIAVRSGDALRLGRLRADVLWPPDPSGATAEPNHRSVVLHVRWRRFDLLLTGDAEAEAAPFEPPRVEVLKVAHHGSEDAGLPELLRRTMPRLAIISVGEENTYGHPHPSTLAALRDAGVPVLRTDESGDVVLDAGRSGMHVAE